LLEFLDLAGKVLGLAGRSLETLQPARDERGRARVTTGDLAERLPTVRGLKGALFAFLHRLDRVVAHGHGEPEVTVLLGLPLGGAATAPATGGVLRSLFPGVVVFVRELLSRGSEVILEGGIRCKQRARQQSQCAEQDSSFHIDTVLTLQP